MALSSRQQIEDRVIALIGLNLLKSENPTTGYLAMIGPYNGEIDQIDGPDDLTRLTRGRFPSILVMAEGASYRTRNISRTRFDRNQTISLITLSNHLRSRESRLRADIVHKDDATRDPGIYKILEDTHQILAGENLGIHGAHYIDSEREDLLLQVDNFTAWRQQFSIRIEANVAKRDDGNGFYTSQHIKSQLDGVGKDVSPNPLVEAFTD